MIVRNCTFCGEPATYDFATVQGRWAYGCDECRRTLGRSAKDGVGLATRLDGSTTRRDIPTEIRSIADEMGFDGGDDEIEAMMEVSAIMSEPSMNELVSAANRTAEIDESGDASILNWLIENRARLVEDETITIRQMLTEYLVWANGEGWKAFLATAEVGDVPTK